MTEIVEREIENVPSESNIQIKKIKRQISKLKVNGILRIQEVTANSKNRKQYIYTVEMESYIYVTYKTNTCISKFQ